MCLTTPAKIISIKNNIAQVQVAGGKREVKCPALSLKGGDWILVNADLAVEKISAKEAREISELIKFKKS